MVESHGSEISVVDRDDLLDAMPFCEGENDRVNV